MSTDKIVPVHLEALRACGDNQEENNMLKSSKNQYPAQLEPCHGSAVSFGSHPHSRGA